MQVYLHIPFCHRICPYCSFYKHTPGNTDMRAFIQALGEEADYYRESFAREGSVEKVVLSTLYLGGGTPSMLSKTLLSTLFDRLHSSFDLSQLSELTFEANPATFNLDKAKFFKELGITRVSLGIQSFDDKILKTLGREHSREQAMDAVSILRQAGISEVNIDLMFSIPGQSLASWRDTLETAISLKPDHISAYNLTYEEDTAFIDKLTAGEYVDDPEVNAEYYTLAEQLLTAAGFEHYETSNYAQPGKQSRHNLSYWQGSDYLGIGPSAVSTISRDNTAELGSTRWKNLPDTAKYIQQINHVGHAKTEVENLSVDDLRLERIALMLRTKEGLDLSLLADDERAKVDVLIEESVARIEVRGDAEKLVLSDSGGLLVDSVVEHLVL